MAAISIVPRGDGTTEPVDTYSGRSSSGVCAKKQTRRAHAMPSLHSRVRYCVGWYFLGSRRRAFSPG